MLQLEAALPRRQTRLLAMTAVSLVVDDTALPKKGRHSIGVAPQYASSLGKTANCQIASLADVSVAGGAGDRGSAAVPARDLDSDPGACAPGRCAEGSTGRLTKPEIAIEEIDRVIASGVRFGCVLADFRATGSSGAFPSGFDSAESAWAWALSRHQNVYPADVGLIFPHREGRKAPQSHIPVSAPVSAEGVVGEGNGEPVQWRRGTKGRLTCLFAARRVRVAGMAVSAPDAR